jgi:hypothetical protein
MEDAEMSSGRDTKASGKDSLPQEVRSSVHEHWIQDTLEDDDIREALKRHSSLDQNDNARPNQGK